MSSSLAALLPHPEAEAGLTDWKYGNTPRLSNTTRTIRITFEVPEDVGPALRSAIDEISNEVGGRLTASHAFPKEQALTDAAIGLGKLRAAVNAKVSEPDPRYDE